ncbi:MAG: archaetidylinositol phosphate synthase [Chloroflexota bacterium]|nr:archaetidylinositol phosphate synthase [Chloroflexota bacterium]
MTKLPESRKLIANYVTQPAARLLARTAITPNALTWSGFLVTLGAAALTATGHPFAGGWVVLAGGLLDMLDGALARQTNRTSNFGALLDSTLDRLSDAAILFGILLLGIREQATMLTWLVYLALIGSLLVSYVRARAEGLGLKCQVGLFTRAERVILLVLSLLLYRVPYVPVTALGIIALLSFITVAQRVIYVWQQTGKAR